MVRLAYVDSAETFVYITKSLTTGATCGIRVVDMSGDKVVDDVAMSEISVTNVPGRYKYAWTPSAVGTYAVYMFEGSLASPTWLQREEVYVTSSRTGCYTSTDDVRAITTQDLSTTDVSDINLDKIIMYAVADVNNAICSKKYNEDIVYIDAYRENRCNGSNVTFYIKDSFSWYFGDMDDDGLLSVDDITVWLYDSSDNTRTQQTVTTIEEYGAFTLATAPPSTTDKLTVTYRRCPVSLGDKELKKACALLTASYAYGGIDAREKKRVSIRSFSISRNPQAEREYYEKYKRCVVKLISREPYGKSRQKEWLYPVGQYPVGTIPGNYI